MADQPKEVHLLSLKVMRLTKPSLEKDRPIQVEIGDVPNDCLGVPGVDSAVKVAVSDRLVLPQMFGSIFLGETFSSYVVTHNDSKEAVSNVILKAELQTASQRVVLTSAEAAPTESLHPGDSVDSVVSHEVKELGVHILVCSVTYSYMKAGEEERKFFKKFFKFQVLKPLDVKTKAYNVDADIYLEAQIQNIMPNPMFLASVTLQPTAGYTAIDLNTRASEANSDPVSVFGAISYLKSQDSRQYLYQLKPKDTDDATLRATTLVGKLDVVWRTNMGEQGRLQTSQLTRKPPPTRDIEVTVLKAPGEVRSGQRFTFVIAVTNRSSSEMALGLREDQQKADAILLDGLSGSTISTLKPEELVELRLDLIAVKSGMQSIKSLFLYDRLTRKPYPLVPLPSVFVAKPLSS